MMNKENPMEKFNFLIGRWNLEYDIPKSQFSEADTGKGNGEFKFILNNKYVTFDYEAKLTKTKTAAHAVFVWDKRTNNYKYWWYEDSGEFMEATCNFLNENTLCFNWHNSLLVQTFQKKSDGKIKLEMRYPKNKDDYEIILNVILTKVEK